MSRTGASVERRDFDTPRDVAEQFPYVMHHRLQLNTSARMDNLSKGRLIQDCLDGVRMPPMGVRSK